MITPDSAQKSETPLAGGVVAEETKENRAPIIGSADDTRKRIDTLKAKFAILGHQVHDLACGGYLVTKWSGWARECPDAAALGAFLRQIGGAQ